MYSWAEVAGDRRGWAEHLPPGQMLHCSLVHAIPSCPSILTLELPKPVPTSNTVVPVVITAINYVICKCCIKQIRNTEILL